MTTSRKRIFEVKVGDSVALPTCSVGVLTYSYHLRKGSMRVSSDYQDGASRADLSSSWLLEDMLNPQFPRTLQPFPLRSGEENSHFGQFWGMCTCLSSGSFPSPSPCPYALLAAVAYKRSITWKLWIKFYLGRNEDCSLGGSISDSSERLLQSDSGGEVYI